VTVAQKKSADDIFYEFQFGRPRQTCLSAIILKEITIYSFMLTKTPGTIIDHDATGAFIRVLCGIALIALRSIGFATSITRMLGLTWSSKKCYIKAVFGVYDSFYQSTVFGARTPVTNVTEANIKNAASVDMKMKTGATLLHVKELAHLSSVQAHGLSCAER
jgi:hypothetical protein